MGPAASEHSLSGITVGQVMVKAIKRAQLCAPSRRIHAHVQLERLRILANNDAGFASLTQQSAMALCCHVQLSRASLIVQQHRAIA